MTSDFQKSIKTAIAEHFSSNAQQGSTRSSKDKKDIAEELEFRFGTFDTKNQFIASIEFDKFKQVISKLRELSGITEGKSDITLNISLNHTKLLKSINSDLVDARAIVPSSQIQTFCLTSEIKDLEVKSSLNTDNIKDWNLRLQTSNERSITDNTVKSQFSELIKDAKFQKHYRLKKRLSFNGPMMKNRDNKEKQAYRVDATIVKQALGSSYEMSNIYSGNEHYELEIESDPEFLFTGIAPNDVDARTKIYYDSVIEILEIIKSTLDESAIPVSETEKQIVLTDYKLSFFSKKERENAPNDGRMRRYFAGMDVNPFEIKHILPKKTPQGISIPIIDGSYYVTMKADGVRNLLYFPNEVPELGQGLGRGYFIDHNLNVRYSGLTDLNLIGAVFDGEYMKDTNEFLIFDYLMEPSETQGKDIRGLKFSDRIKKLKTLNIPSADSAISESKEKQEQKKDKEKVTLKLKEHYHIDKSDKLSSLGDVIKKVENSLSAKRYEQDGYIFTPDEAYPTASLTNIVRWPRNLKWKPIEQLSNDFLVKKLPKVNSNDPFQKLSLLAKYQGRLQPFTSPDDFVDGVDNVAKVLIDSDGQIRTTEDKKIIYDDSVVEFIWGDLDQGLQSSTQKEGWIPIRVREDKSRTKDPNAMSTVQSNWKLIKNPISLEMLKGSEPISSHYYWLVDESLKELNETMRRFHNIVKNDLIVGAAEKIREEQGPDTPIRILDLAVGRFGDLGKWGNARARSVLGIDLSQAGIEKDRYQPNAGYKVELDGVWGDSSKNINNLDAAKNENYKKILEKALEKNAPGFNIISIMFALHYFMKDDASINGLFQNISEMMMPGGYLIGTTLDGNKVSDAFNRAGSFTIAGVEKNRGIDIWRLTRDYKKDDLDNTPGLSENAQVATGALGRKIKVNQISIGQEISEYLVDFDYLEQVAKKYGFVPETFGAFSIGGDFSNYNSPSRKKGNMADFEREYNDMNRYFIFKKLDQTPSVLERFTGTSKPRVTTAKETAPGPAQVSSAKQTRVAKPTAATTAATLAATPAATPVATTAATPVAKPVATTAAKASSRPLVSSSRPLVSKTPASEAATPTTTSTSTSTVAKPRLSAVIRKPREMTKDSDSATAAETKTEPKTEKETNKAAASTVSSVASTVSSEASAAPPAPTAKGPPKRVLPPTAASRASAAQALRPPTTQKPTK